MFRDYQVVVIGGGHAGVEAAWAAANLLGPVCSGKQGRQATVALVTIDPAKIGVMSCNPAIGGLAKGQLVREIDALGGLMGLATDATGIQFKVLNISRGPAVHGPRAQCDKHAYAEAVQMLIASRPEIDVIAGTVERFVVEQGRIKGVLVKPNEIANRKWQIANEGGGTGSDLPFAHLPFAISAPAVVLTTGTFMRGLMHTGDAKSEGGRFGEAAAVGISGALRDLGFELGRLKTGTPPRLRKGSIRWDDLPPQWGDDEPTPFCDLTLDEPRASARESGRACAHGRTLPELALGALSDWRESGFLFDRFPLLPQVACRQTSTNGAAHDVIRANLHRAPMYSGQIESVGPRYCPSIEDKVVRFAERDTHGVFLEPESLRDDWIYCNGISTSLPRDVQDALVRTMPGCENAEILRYGYAVEYDMVRPHQIHATGMTKLVEGLFLAGQINGTSGYEEAAAQGLVAGVNAARFALGHSEWVLGRHEAYIGVMMDDLVTKTPVEPYRMFTSRAEHRLLLRADNAPDRLTPVARELGLLSNTDLGLRRATWLDERRALVAELNDHIDRARIDGMPLGDLLRKPEFESGHLRAWLEREHPALARRARRVRALETVFADRKYAAYLVRQRAEIKRHAEIEHRRIPDGIRFEAMDALRTEARQALARFRPSTFGQAGRLEGVTPADLTLLAVLVKRQAVGS